MEMHSREYNGATQRYVNIYRGSLHNRFVKLCAGKYGFPVFLMITRKVAIEIYSSYMCKN